MNADSEHIIQTHLNRMKGLIQSMVSEHSNSEKRITKNFIQSSQEQFESSRDEASGPPSDVAEDSFEKVSYYIDLTLRTFDKISSPNLDEAQKAKFIYMLSETYETLGNYDAALNNYAKAAVLALKDNNQGLYGQIQYRMARIQAEMGKWVQADNLLNEAIVSLQNFGDFSGVALAKLEMARTAYKKGEYLKAEDLFQAALEASEFVNDVANTAIINNHLGVILRMQGKYEQGFRFFQRALIDFQSIQNKQGAAESLNNLGVVYLKKHDLPHAIGYFEKALAICQESGILPLMAFIYLNKGEFYTEVGDFPMAATACGKALEILIRLKNPTGIAKTNNLLGRIFRKSGDPELAKSFYLESIRLYETFGIPLGLANSCEEFATMLEETGEKSEAREMSEKAKKIFSRLDIVVETDDRKEMELTDSGFE